MAKKKKSKLKDARGYSQSQGGPQHPSKGSAASSSNVNVKPSKKAPSVSTKTHHDMKELLNQFEFGNVVHQDNTMIESTAASKSSSSKPTSNTNTTNRMIPPSDRFQTKLTNIVNTLDILQFTPTQIELVITSLQYQVTLESALDWLCLHLSTLDLPALFTDGELRQDMGQVTTVDSLVVVRAQEKKSADNRYGAEDGDGDGSAENNDNVLVVPMDMMDNSKAKEVGYKSSKGEVEKKEQQDEAERQQEKDRKDWLLQQYQYEDEEEEEEEEKEGDNKAVESHDIDEKVQALLSPEEQQLAKEEAALAELDADANNDANNYMRSKGEIKELKIQVKKMRQRVAGLRRRVEKDRALQLKLGKEKEEEEAAMNKSSLIEENGGVNQEEEECGGGFFDMFGTNDEDEEDECPAGEEEPTKVEDKPAIRDLTIPTGWTGSTPQKKLDEVLKKQKLRRARYTKLPMNAGYSLNVTVHKKRPNITIDKKRPPETNHYEAKSINFVEGSSLKDYLAILALYDIDPTIQLYQIFPPTFRELWLSWMNQVREEKDQEQKVQDDAKRERIEHLMSLIAGLQIDQKANGTSEKSDCLPEDEADINNQLNDDAVTDNWDDESTDDGTQAKTKPTQQSPSIMGQKLQLEFAKRRSTPTYQKMKATRDNLPMLSYRSTILETVQNNPVTIICAETGAGKSTQCGQYILEQALLDGHSDEVNIICTQPRRVAATSLAERVSDEMCDKLGKMVGYQIRMEAKRSAQTKLLFCTTGVILRRLQDDPTLSGITHIIVDEVHERQQQIDVLLIILRQLIQTTRPDLKVVLMSATMETELFTSFFSFQGAATPLISVPGRTFPVVPYYLEDLLDATGHIIEEGSRYAFRENNYGETASLWVTTRGGEKRKEMVDLTSQVTPGDVSDVYSEYTMATRRSMERVNEEIINFDLVEDLLKLITSKDNDTLLPPEGADLSCGSVLIFLPGLGEIKALIERLEGSRLFRDKQRFDLIPLHSTLSSQDQRRAFIPSKWGCRKIICATNIAETSVTIPDVVCVIDTGRGREVRRNKRTSTSMLVTDWCPQSSAKQRQGRAGRVQPGICLKLYSSTTAERVMKVTNEPELRRVPLEEVCMTILGSGYATNCSDFLDQAPQPPSKDAVKAAMDVLYDVGAIERISDQFERLTPLGRHLAKLPVDVKLGKMLIYGALFRCIDPIITIAASLSSKSPFSSFVNDAAVAKAKQSKFADKDSDFITFVNVWNAYSEAAETSSSAGRRFCQENYLNYVALREISDARRQFLDLLCSLGFIDRSAVMGNGSRIDPAKLRGCKFNRYARKEEVVHTVLCAGLYPNIAHLDQSPTMDYTMWHKKERLYFHGSSVNGGSKKKCFSTSDWVIFHEKFGTSNNRTSVATTGFVHPFAVLLFGDPIVKHLERMVVVDDWMNVGMSAQTGVILCELRKQVDVLLQRMIECANPDEKQHLDATAIDGIVNIISS